MTRTLAYDLEITRDEALAVEIEDALKPTLYAITTAVRAVADAAKGDLGHAAAVRAADLVEETIWEWGGKAIIQQQAAEDERKADLLDWGADLGALRTEALRAGLEHDDRLLAAYQEARQRDAERRVA